MHSDHVTDTSARQIATLQAIINSYEVRRYEFPARYTILFFDSWRNDKDTKVFVGLTHLDHLVSRLIHNAMIGFGNETWDLRRSRAKSVDKIAQRSARQTYTILRRAAEAVEAESNTKVNIALNEMDLARKAEKEEPAA